MEVVLDTNAVSCLLKGDNQLLEVLEPFSKLLLPAIVVGEYLFGIRGSQKDKELSIAFAELVNICEMVPIDVKSAEQYAFIRFQLKSAGTPIPSNDVWVASVALAKNSPILTRDKHFSLVSGVRVLSW